MFQTAAHEWDEMYDTTVTSPVRDTYRYIHCNKPVYIFVCLLVYVLLQALLVAAATLQYC